MAVETGFAPGESGSQFVNKMAKTPSLGPRKIRVERNLKFRNLRSSRSDMRKLTNEVKVNKCIHRISSYREEETLLFSVLSSFGPECVRPVVLRFTMSHSPAVSREGDESELENTKQGDNPPGRRRGR